MNNISWRHHYLPVFYLKGFTKESGKFKIYNVKNKKFVQNGKEFSPESYFFEKNANTVFKPHGNSDFIENAYSELEGKISKLIAKINASDNVTKFDVNENDMPMLNTFVSLNYWRLPKNKNELETIVNISPTKELGFNVHNKNGSINIGASEELKNDSEFLKSYRFLTSLFDTVRGLHCRTPYTIIQKHEDLPYLCSDNPIIFGKDDFPDVYQDDYIIPLSGKRFFIKAKGGSKADYYLWLLIDIVIYKQAIKYVSCTHEEYLKMLDDNFEKYNVSLSELKKLIFKKLNENVT
ncbi:DUF4238 domain-containing protein [Flavobacterium sp. ZS1P70]|uniref:DUF4238 domain-containing protein n=1 Tax=Flavobacterium zhoui TaxID=3230414 RepID=A0ABW6I6N4_9FLAO